MDLDVESVGLKSVDVVLENVICQVGCDAPVGMFQQREVRC